VAADRRMILTPWMLGDARHGTRSGKRYRDQNAIEALSLLLGRLARNGVDRPGADVDRDVGVRLEVGTSWKW